MAEPTHSGIPLLRHWLESALPTKPFIYRGGASQQRAGHDPIYAPLAESITVERWDELGRLPDLWPLCLGRHHALDGSLTFAEPIVIFDAFRVLFVEANLEHFLNQSLVYCVNAALHLYDPPITIIPHVPFTAPSLREHSFRSQESYTPDYTICKGRIEENPGLLDDHRTSFLVGDAKLVGPQKPKNAVTYTGFLNWSALGQLLWYCVCRETRFASHISDQELVLMEFVVSREDSVTGVSNAVIRAESELSSPGFTLPLGNHRQPSKRKYASSPASNSTVSPSDRHQQKRSIAPPQVEDNEALQPQDTAPRTPEPKFKSPEHSSSSYVLSSPGGISAGTIKNLASAGGDFRARLCPFPLPKPERIPLALLGFIGLAQLVDIKKSKNISATPTSLEEFLGTLVARTISVDDQAGLRI